MFNIFSLIIISADMDLILAVMIMLIVLICYYIVAHTGASELFGIDRSTEPAVHYFGDFQDISRPVIGLLGGVHGNEPSGSTALNELIAEGFFEHATATEKLNFIVIPEANEYGLRNGVRWSGNIIQPDINRSFLSEKGDDKISAFILDSFSNVNLLVDFHEGWGWYNAGNGSIGSTISSTITESGKAKLVGDAIVSSLNKNITDPKKQFVMLPDISCDIKSALSCRMEKSGKDYVLMETTGQKNVQPLTLRVNQVKTAVAAIIDSFRTE